MGEDEPAGEAQQNGEQDRDQERAFERVAERQSLRRCAPADQPVAGRQPMDGECGLLRRGRILEPQQAAAISLLERLLGPREIGEIAGHRPAGAVEQPDCCFFALAVIDGVGDGPAKSGHPAGPIDVGEHRALLDHLVTKGGRRRIMGAQINEAEHREIRHQREQAREQRNPQCGGQGAQAASI